MLCGFEDLALFEADVRLEQIAEATHLGPARRRGRGQRAKRGVIVANPLRESRLAQGLERGQQVPLLDPEVRLQMRRQGFPNLLPDGLGRNRGSGARRLLAAAREDERGVVVVGEVAKLGESFHSPILALGALALVRFGVFHLLLELLQAALDLLEALA